MFSNLSRFNFCQVPRFYCNLSWIVLIYLGSWEPNTKVKCIGCQQSLAKEGCCARPRIQHTGLASNMSVWNFCLVKKCGLVSLDTNESLDNGSFILSHDFTIFHHGLLSKLYAFCAASHSIHLQSLGFVLMIEARKSTDLVKEVNHIIQWPHDIPACALHMFALLMPFCCRVSQKGFTLFAMSCSRKVVFYVFL